MCMCVCVCVFSACVCAYVSYLQLWIAAMSQTADALCTGYARVKKCTLEGRAAMGMDLAYVEKVARQLLPAGAAQAGLAALRRTDDYVRAYYLPWNEFTE